MVDEREEGWYEDPYGLHEARWISAGTPTKLVRDGDVESYEDPPDEEPTLPLVPIEEKAASDGRDLLRADDAEGADSAHGGMSDAARFGSTWGSHIAMPGPRDE